MAKKSYSKKYKIITSFDYRGADGKSRTSIRLGPGEEVPKLNKDMLNQLIAREKIAEVSSETGEIIRTKKVIVLRDGEIDKFMNKSPSTIMLALKNNNFSTETLSKIFIYAEKKKLPNTLIDFIDKTISARVSS